MKKLYLTGMAALLLAPSLANAAAYKVTIDGEAQTVCHASTAAWAMYNAGKEGDATVSVTKLDPETKAAKDCAKVAAKKADERAALKQSTKAEG